MVRLENLTMRYREGRGGVGETTALRGVSLQIPRGEYWVIVGPSGSGKSTTLRIIAGLEEPDAGEVWLEGRPMRGVPAPDRDVAMVFQEHPLFPHLNVEENLRFPLRFRRLAADEIQARVAEAVGWVGVGGLLGRAVGRLSGGERQRVALGMALVRRPRLLLLDEPLAQLDAPARSELRRELRSLQRRLGLTVLHVTHDQVEAGALGDQVVMLEAGVVRQIAAPLALYREPADLTVARFFGGSAYNLLAGHLRAEGDGGQACFVGENGWQWRVPPQLSPRIRAGARADNRGADVLGHGERVWLGIPARSLVVSEASGAGAAGDDWLAVVEGREFGSDRVQLELRLPGGPRWVAGVPWQGRVPEVGESVAVRLVGGEVHWFADSDGRRRGA